MAKAPSTSASGQKGSGRRPRKRQYIVHDLRAQIVSGRFAPGSRLPAQSDLQSHYSTGTVTVQQAIDRLVSDGFIRTDGRRGTFVVDHPPHLTHYAVVFPEDPGRPTSGAWSQFWSVVQRGIEGLPAAADRKLKPYYNIYAGEDARDYHRLIRDVERRRLAGAIFVGPPYPLDDTPIMSQPDLPRIAIMDDPGIPGIPHIYMDYESFFSRCLELLASAGRKRIAFLGFAPMVDRVEAKIRELLDRWHLETRPYWRQYATPALPLSIRNLTSLLMSNPANRPDALVITDDNLVEQATAAIAEMGIQDELSIITHCNFPFPTPAHVAVTRIGFDIQWMLNLCVELLNRQREGQSVEPATLIPATMNHDSERSAIVADPIRTNGEAMNSEAKVR